MGRLGRKEKRARALSIFSSIAIFIEIPSGSLREGERSQRETQSAWQAFEREGEGNEDAG